MKIIQYIKNEHYEAIVTESSVFERFHLPTGIMKGCALEREWTEWELKELPFFFEDSEELDR